MGITQLWSSGTWGPEWLSRQGPRLLPEAPPEDWPCLPWSGRCGQAFTASALCPGVTTEPTVWGQIPGCSDLASLQCRDLHTHVA